MARCELLDGGLVVAQLGEDLRRVLAQERGHARDAGPLAVPPDGKADGAVVGYPWVLGRDQHAAGLGLRQGGDLVERLDGRARHTRTVETIEELGARESARDGREGVDELRAVLDPRRIICKARIVRQVTGAQGS